MKRTTGLSACLAAASVLALAACGVPSSDVIQAGDPAVGMAPGWLYELTPATALNFNPYTPDRLVPQLELLGAGGAAFLLMSAAGLLPVERPVRLLDLDALYRGPITATGRWCGVVALRAYGASQDFWDAIWARLWKLCAGWAKSCDRPYALAWAGAAQFAAIGLVLAIILIARL